MDDYADSSEAPWYDQPFSIAKLVLEEGITRIGSYAFRWAVFPADMELVIPDSVTSIGEYAFGGCSNFTSIKFGKNLQSIEQYAFDQCARIETLNFPASIKEIGDSAFSSCAGVTRIVFNGDAPVFGIDTFYPLCASVFYPANNATWTADVMQNYGGQLTWVAGEPTSAPVVIATGDCTGQGSDTVVTWTLYDNGHLAVTGTGDMVAVSMFNSPWYFCRDSIRTASISEGVTNVGANNFVDCKNLQRVTLPSTVKSIGYCAFYGCNALTTINLPAGLEIIDNNAFECCYMLNDITLPDSLTTLGTAAFSECTGLTEIRIPGGIININERAFFRCDSLESVIIEDGVKIISAKALYGCHFQSIVIPDSVFFIGAEAFSFNDYLESVTLSNHLTEMGANAFSWCPALRSIELPDSLTVIPECAFYSSGLQKVKFGAHVTSIGPRAFRDSRLTSVVIPNEVTEIGDAAFDGCYYLEDVTLGNQVATIGDAAFSGCGNLSFITIPASVTYIGNRAFFYCRHLLCMVFQGDVPTINGSIFVNDDLTAYYPADNATWTEEVKQNYGGTVTWVPGTPETNPIIVAEGTCGDGLSWTLDCLGELIISGSGALPDFYYETNPVPWNSYDSKIHDIVVSDGITRIGADAFSNCYYASSLHIGKDVAQIEGSGMGLSLKEFTVDPQNETFSVVDGILFNDPQKTLVYCPRNYTGTYTVPEGIEIIGSYAFSECRDMEGIKLPSTLKTIEERAFFYAGLSEVTIPQGVTYIGEGAFDSCYLTEVVLPDSVQYIGDAAFYSAWISEITIPKNVTYLGVGAFGNCYSLIKVTIETSHPGLNFNACFEYSDYLSVIETSADNTGYCVENGILYSKDMTKLVFCPPTVCDTVIIPEGVVEIAPYAFQGCGNVTEVKFPSTLEVIGECAFMLCDALIRVEMPDSVTFMGKSAFSMCTALTEVTLSKSLTVIPEAAFSYDNSISSIEIPNGVTTIGVSAFYCCEGMGPVVIPASVITLEQNAFDVCRGMGQVTFLGDAPTMGEYTFGELTADIYYPANNDTWTADKMLDYNGELTWIASDGSKTTTTVSAGWCGDNAKWHLNSDGALVIYPAVDEAEVTWGSYTDEVTSIFICEGITALSNEALAGCQNATQVTFLGDAPTIGESTFSSITATVTYPGDNATWTADKLQNYGGTLTWVADGPVVLPTLTPAYATLALEDEVKYNLYFTAADLGDLTVGDMGLITFKTKVEDGTIDNADAVIPGAYTSGSYYYVQSEGIPAKELGDDMYFRVYVKLADGTYVYSKMVSYSAVKYVNSTLNKASSSENLKKTCVALLNYGAAAQEYFGYKTDSLMNAGLTAEQQALVGSYSADMVSPLVKVDSSKIGQFAYTADGFAKRYPSVSLEGSFAINYYFAPSKAMDGNMTFYYWDLETYNAVSELTVENATGSMVMEAAANGEYTAAVSGIAAKAVDETVFVAAVYESEGVQYSTGVLAYSVATACKGKVNGSDAAQAALAETIVVYGSCAKNYFGN